MKIFVFGSNGMLGTYMCSYLSKTYKVIPITRADYDLSTVQIKTLKDLLLSKNIEKDNLVLNCAGVIPQASKQRDLYKNLYYRINSMFPVMLSMICEKIGANMIHITTDCVFDGKLGNYHEKSDHTETNDYGVSKSLGELCDATIIRTSIIGEEKLNKRSLLEWIRTNKNGSINGFVNHHWNGVTCLELSKIVLEVIESGIYWKGVRHIFSPTSVTKYELVKMINNVYGLGIEIKPHETETVDKTITTVYDKKFQIKELFEQIKELKEYYLY
jgi:dTDP-4-dehydrorhamnose reductase